LFRRRHIAVQVDFTNREVSTEPALAGVSADDTNMVWLRQLMAKVPDASVVTVPAARTA
jgi:hypothetical protein